jgi:transcriptional regulator with XRE-family HTH domain
MNIKECRLATGMKQADLANLLGINTTTVSKWEVGESAPRASQIPAVADALNCSIDALFGREIPSTSNQECK